MLQKAIELVGSRLGDTLNGGGERIENVEEVESKVFAGEVNAGHQDFNTPQDAIEWANDNGYYEVRIPPGTYNTTIEPYSDMYIHGAGSGISAATEISTGDSVALDLNANIADLVDIENLKLTTNSGTRAIQIFGDSNDCRFENISTTQAGNVFCDGTNIYFIHMNIDSLEFSTNSRNCIVTNSRVNSQTNSGSNNILTNNVT